MSSHFFGACGHHNVETSTAVCPFWFPHPMTGTLWKSMKILWMKTPVRLPRIGAVIGTHHQWCPALKWNRGEAVRQIGTTALPLNGCKGRSELCEQRCLVPLHILGPIAGLDTFSTHQDNCCREGHFPHQPRKVLVHCLQVSCCTGEMVCVILMSMTIRQSQTHTSFPSPFPITLTPPLPSSYTYFLEI